MRGFIRSLIPILFVAILGRTVGLSFASPTMPLHDSGHASLVQGDAAPSAPIQDPRLADFQKVRKHHRRVRKQLTKAFVTLPTSNHFAPELGLAATAGPSQTSPFLVSVDTLSRPPCC